VAVRLLIVYQCGVWHGMAFAVYKGKRMRRDEMRRTKDQIKYEDKLRRALSEEERYMGSVFVTPMGQRKHEEAVKQAYIDYRRVGGNKDL
jgi:hypothetical protein